MSDNEILAQILRRVLLSRDQYINWGEHPDGTAGLTLDGEWSLSVDELAAVRAVGGVTFWDRNEAR